MVTSALYVYPSNEHLDWLLQQTLDINSNSVDISITSDAIKISLLDFQNILSVVVHDLVLVSCNNFGEAIFSMHCLFTGGKGLKFYSFDDLILLQSFYEGFCLDWRFYYFKHYKIKYRWNAKTERVLIQSSFSRPFDIKVYLYLSNKLSNR